MGLQRLADAGPGLGVDLDAVLAQPARRDVLVAVVAASRFLTRILETDPAAWTVLADLDHRPSPPLGAMTQVAAWKQRELLRLAARDLAGRDELEATGAGLAALAREVLDAAVALGGAEGLAVVGMGKLGGDELNYASDVDVIFVGDGDPGTLERAAREVLALAGTCFRMDANLRPEGRDGKLVRSLDSYEAYWDRWAQPWEFQALLKARPAAGDPLLGARFLDTAQRWLWSRPFGADELRHLRHLKERAESEVARRGTGDREIKRGTGGIRDIEFTVQLLQLVHGAHDPGLRSPTTLTALAELAAAGYVDDADGDALADAYRFLRAVEHRLQLVDDQQVHTVPDAAASREHLARTLGLRAGPDGDAVTQFDRRLRRVQNRVRSIHERVYFRPLLEAFATSGGTLSPEAAEARLTAFGFTDAKRTQAAVRELTRGLNRTSRLMQQLLPLMLDWLSTSPDPDLGLLLLRNLLDSSPPTRTELAEAFRDSPEVARLLCRVLGTSRVVAEGLTHNPDLVARLPYPDRLATRPRDELVVSAARAVLWRDGRDARQEGLRRWKERHLLGIQARDLLHGERVERIGTDLTALAEATVETALAALEPGAAFSVVALGRFGGSALSYASDLDVVFVYDGEGASAFEEADRVAKALLRSVNGAAPAERIFEIDAQLRPEGNQGPMARSLDGYRRYFERWALVWERQAYLLARPVAGDPEVGAALLALLEPHLWSAPFTTEDEREIRRLKARVEQERIPAGQDPRFHLKLGPGGLADIEWTAQLLQLRHGLRAPGPLAALREASAGGHLDPTDADTLAATYELLERLRNRLYLVRSGRHDMLPTQPEELTWLARSLGTNAAALREDYRRATRRARRVVEQVFFGTGT